MKISAFWKIIRPLNTGITFFVVFLLIIALNPSIVLNTALLAALSAGLSAAAGNVINDICDIEIDKINRPERILASGLLSRRTAGVYCFFLFAGSYVSAAFISHLAFSIVVAANLFLVLYSLRLKRVILAGNFVVAGLTGLACLYAGVIAGQIGPSFVFAGFAFLVNLIREIIKDIEDREGDGKNGVITFVTKYGIRKTRMLVKVLTVLLILLTCVPVAAGVLRLEFFIVCMVFVNPVLVFMLKYLAGDDYESKLRKMGNMLKFCMVAGLLAIYFGIPR
jgi:geranylgeranylglycerol-phosphate geranylgeranyltransferase